jgi:hypothetical protein
MFLFGLLALMWAVLYLAKIAQPSTWFSQSCTKPKQAGRRVAPYFPCTAARWWGLTKHFVVWFGKLVGCGRDAVASVIVRGITGGMFVSDKCPMCDSTTTEVIDLDSTDLLKVRCEACGYENVEFTRTSNENPNRGKSQNKKTPFVDLTNVFSFFGGLILLLPAALFLNDRSRSLGSGGFLPEKLHLLIEKVIFFPLIGVSVLSLILVVKNFNHRLKQLEARQADED